MTEPLHNLIDTAAQVLVTADIFVLQDLGKLYTCFERIAARTQADDSAGICDAAHAAALLVKRMMLDETARTEQVPDILSKTITIMQQRARPGADPNLYCFPDGLLSAPAGGQPQQSSSAFTLPPHIGEDIFNDFLNDQDAILERLDNNLLAIEKQYSAEQMADVRRIFHTLKGEAAIFELNEIQRLCHDTEDLIHAAGSAPPVDTLLGISDWLKTVFDALKHHREIPVMPGTIQTLLQQSPVAKDAADIKQLQDVPAPEDFNGAVIINRAFTEERDAQRQKQQFITADMDLLSDFVSEVQEHIETIDTKLLTLEQNPHENDVLNAVFRVFHTIKGAAGFLSLDDIARLAHTTESLLDGARKGDITLGEGMIDVVFAAVDEMKKLVSGIAEAIGRGETTYAHDPSLEAVIEKLRAASAMNVAPMPSSPMPVSALHGEAASRDNGSARVAGSTIQAVDDSTPDIDSAFSIQKVVLATQDGFTGTSHVQRGKIKESIKVDSENLDKLIDAIGELVIIESMIKQDSDLKSGASARMQRNIAQMDKITRELQQLGMSLRMIPVKGTFQKMARVVRDLAKKSGKVIEFITRGEDTMLDKSVVDRIGDPLIHLVRNSVDHGIEQCSENRVHAGKPQAGRIELTAFHKGGNIYIEIIDDGRGLDRELIFEKAKQKGLERDGQSLSDREIFNFIFLPGFSTAQKVTDVSGRGVGMDVVKRTIEDLRGNIDIESLPGKGTIFSLRLPLTLAIIDGMMVRIGDERYIIPTLSIVEALRPRQQDIASIVNRGEMLQLRDRLIPLFRLSRLFTIEGAVQDPTEGIVIVVEDSGKMTGILVDELLGQQSTVIKNLGAYMTGLTGVSGGSIMSDGKVGIIIDIAGIIKLATAQHDSYHRQPAGV